MAAIHDLLGYIEVVIVIAMAVIGSWIQTNIRINSSKERIDALRDDHNKLEKDVKNKADMAYATEMKADLRHSIDELKGDINKRLDSIMAMLVDMQKKIG